MDIKSRIEQIISNNIEIGETENRLDYIVHNTSELAEEIVKLFDIPFVSGSLLRSKAKEYAKFKHQDEYNDPIYHRDVLETLNDFESGYKAAMKDCNDR